MPGVLHRFGYIVQGVAIVLYQDMFYAIKGEQSVVMMLCCDVVSGYDVMLLVYGLFQSSQADT